MNVQDRHQVLIDVTGEHSDVWSATWQRDGYIYVHHGSEIDSQIKMDLYSVAVYPDPGLGSVAADIANFCEVAEALLRAAIEANR